MAAQIYKPKGPYKIKSGENAGKILEALMFKRYWLLQHMLNKIRKEPVKIKNELHKHLEWLLMRGEDRKTVILCPFCEKNLVEYFLAIYYDTLDDPVVDKEHTSCRNCVETLRKMGPSRHEHHIYPFKFSSLAEFHHGLSRVVKLFIKAFGLSLSGQKITKEEAFAFFSREIEQKGQARLL